MAGCSLSEFLILLISIRAVKKDSAPSKVSEGELCLSRTKDAVDVLELGCLWLV